MVRNSTSLNIKFVEVLQQHKRHKKTLEDHDNTFKARKKAKLKVTRLTNKTADAENTIAKHCETMRHLSNLNSSTDLVPFVHYVSPHKGVGPS